jgi:hypothetical protein
MSSERVAVADSVEDATGGSTMIKTTSKRNISLSLPTELVECLDAWAKSEGTNRSAMLAQLIQAERRRRREAQLERDVCDAVADGFYDDIGFYLPAQAEVALANPW